MNHSHLQILAITCIINSSFTIKSMNNTITLHGKNSYNHSASEINYTQEYKHSLLHYLFIKEEIDNDKEDKKHLRTINKTSSNQQIQESDITNSYLDPLFLEEIIIENYAEIKEQLEFYHAQKKQKNYPIKAIRQMSMIELEKQNELQTAFELIKYPHLREGYTTKEIYKLIATKTPEVLLNLSQATDNPKYIKIGYNLLSADEKIAFNSSLEKYQNILLTLLQSVYEPTDITTIDNEEEDDDVCDQINLKNWWLLQSYLSKN